MKKQSFAALFALAVLAFPASAKTYYVTTTGEDADPKVFKNAGLSTNAAFRTIQFAIDKAAAGSTILVYPGTYAPIETNNKKLTIKAVEGAEKTIIDGGDDTSAIGAELGTWGTQTYKATGISETYRNDSTGKKVTLKYYYVDSHDDRQIFEVSVPKGGQFIEENDSESGMLRGTLWLSAPPAWYFDSSDSDWYYDTWNSLPTRTLGKYRTYTGGSNTKLEGFTVTGCHQALRGGVVSSCFVTGNAFYKNGDPDLPGDEAMAYMCKLSDCTFDGNKVCHLIGGKELDNCPTATRCKFLNNEILESGTGYGAGSLFNCLFAGNSSVYEFYGGALIDLDSYYSGCGAYNCTIVSNKMGSDVAVRGTHLYNSIVWGNRNGSGHPANLKFEEYEPYTRTSYASVENPQTKEWDLVEFEETVRPVAAMVNGCIEGDHAPYSSGSVKTKTAVWSNGSDCKIVEKTFKYPASKNNITDDPCFIDPDKGDYHLAPWSPCVDAGADYTKNTGKFDLDGAARKVGKVDMGTYELQPQTAVPADYDYDGVTDAAFYFAASGQWWVFGSQDGIRTLSLPDANATPCPADYDGDGKAEPAYFTAAAKTPEFVRVRTDGTVVRTTFGEKGATPVAAKLPGAAATFGVYTANAKKPAFSFADGTTVEFGAKASRPVVADFDADGADDLGVYTATASKPAFSVLQSSKGYSPAAPFAGGPVALGPKGAIPCCADYDGVGGADFGIYMSNTKEPYFQRLFSSSKFRETRTLPMGGKGDVPVVGVYEAGRPATPAVWTGAVWSFVDSGWDSRTLSL